MDTFTAIKDFGFPVVVCIYLLYTLNYRLETVRKAITDKQDDIIANQLKIIGDVAAIRASQETTEGAKGKSR